MTDNKPAAPCQAKQWCYCCASHLCSVAGHLLVLLACMLYRQTIKLVHLGSMSYTWLPANPMALVKQKQWCYCCASHSCCVERYLLVLLACMLWQQTIKLVYFSSMSGTDIDIAIHGCLQT